MSVIFDGTAFKWALFVDTRTFLISIYFSEIRPIRPGFGRRDSDPDIPLAALESERNGDRSVTLQLQVQARIGWDRSQTAETLYVVFREKRLGLKTGRVKEKTVY
jgi:hypothetical protein